jgi:hypothetical protein
MTDMTVFYACFYCKKDFYLKKERLKTHWVIGCPKNKLCCTSRCCLSLKTTWGLRSCTVYLTPANVDIHVESKLLGALTFPAMTHYFRSKDNWNTVKQYEDANDPSSDED